MDSPLRDMKYFDAFSGYGGFSLGIKRAYEKLCSQNKEQSEMSPFGDSERQCSEQSDDGSKGLTCIGYSEINKYAIETYSKHFPEHKNYGDITKINAEELPDFDLFVGGFPCQAFSIAGKRKGFDDTRGTLFFDIARILRAKRPRLLLLENVKGLLSHDNGQTFSTIIATLNELGYDIQWQVLNSKNHGVPQNRERVFIIGHLRGTSRPEVFPFTYNGGKDIIQLLGGSQSERIYSRKGVSSTLSTMQGGNLQPKVFEGVRIRRLTPTECERLMGLPDGWTKGVSDTQRYKLCGNGVVVNVVEEIIKRLNP